MTTFEVKTEEFQGPLELLLTLIEKRKLYIGDIALAEVADDYISYVNSLDTLPMADTANFLLVASTLVLIKSKALLPGLQLTEEEEHDVEELERRLKFYKRMVGLSKNVKSVYGKNVIFPRRVIMKKVTTFAPDKHTESGYLKEAMYSVLGRLPKPKVLTKKVVQKVMSLEDMITDLTERIHASFNLSFREFSKFGKAEKVNVVVSFLAILELVKQGVIRVQQDNRFSDIHMESETVDTPSYN